MIEQVSGCLIRVGIKYIHTQTHTRHKCVKQNLCECVRIFNIFSCVSSSMKSKFTDRHTNRHLAQLGIHEISEHIDHLAKYQGIEGLRD